MGYLGNLKQVIIKNWSSMPDYTKDVFTYDGYPVQGGGPNYALPNGLSEVLITGSSTGHDTNLTYIFVRIHAAANSHLTNIYIKELRGTAAYCYGLGKLSDLNTWGLANGLHARLLKYGVDAECCLEVTFPRPIRALDGTELYYQFNCTGAQHAHCYHEMTWSEPAW